MNENFDSWLTSTMREYGTLAKYVRYGQHLWNCMPNKFVGKVPHAIDPFYDDSHAQDFLNWLERNWDA